MTHTTNQLEIAVEQHGVRVFFVDGMRKEKPYFALRILEDGETIFEDPWCADNREFCEAKGRRLAAHYQQHGSFPAEEPIAKPFTFKETEPEEP